MNSSGNYHYEYTLADHLGNARLTFDTYSGSAVTTQQDDYYAFGLENNRSWSNPKNEYLYNKKELQEELGQYDYGARFYDPRICKFISVDPLATKYPWYSPYQFAGNEVPNAIDRDGLEPAYPKGDGTYTLVRDGQLQRPLSGSAANKLAAHVNSTAERGGGDHILDAIPETLGNIGTDLQIAGYAMAPFTDGASLGLVAYGEGFDLASGTASIANDSRKGKFGDAAVTATSMVGFGVLGKQVEKLEKAGKITKVDQTVLGAVTFGAGKATDVAIDKSKPEAKKESSKTPIIPLAPLFKMQRDITKTYLQ